MYEITSIKRYQKAVKRVSRHKDFDSDTLESVIDKLAKGEKLEAKYKDHQLKGTLKDFRECHVQNDILLVYQKLNDVLILVLVDLGTHSELF